MFNEAYYDGKDDSTLEVSKLEKTILPKSLESPSPVKTPAKRKLPTEDFGLGLGIALFKRSYYFAILLFGNSTIQEIVLFREVALLKRIGESVRNIIRWR